MDDFSFPMNHREMLALLHAIQACAIALWMIWSEVAFLVIWLVFRRKQ